MTLEEQAAWSACHALDINKAGLPRWKNIHRYCRRSRKSLGVIGYKIKMIVGRTGSWNMARKDSRPTIWDRRKDHAMMRIGYGCARVDEAPATLSYVLI